MNRHLAIVELDTRLFDTADDMAAWLHRAVMRAIRMDMPRIEGSLADLRPAVSCAMSEPRGTAYRHHGPGGGEHASTEHDDGAQLSLASTAALIAELSTRAEFGMTDRGLDYRPVINAGSNV